MKLTRRDLMAGASALAITGSGNALSPQEAPAAAGFNGGKSQGQSTAPNFSGDFPFINLMKLGSGWFGNSSTNSNAYIDPSWLDSNGYPLASFMDGKHGVAYMNIGLPNRASQISNARNPMVVMWEGKSKIAIGNAPITALSGSLVSAFDSSSGLYKGRYVWYPTSYDSVGNYSFRLGVETIAAGSHVNNMQLYFLSDEPALLAGETFTPRFKAVLKQANFGVYRFMDWLRVNDGNVTTWASRKSYGYPTWTEDEYRASLYAGVTTNNGNDYSITPVSSYNWTGSNGNYDGSGPVEKQTMHIRFNADARLIQNTQNTGNLTIKSLSPVTFGWPSNPLADGDIVSVATGISGGNLLENTGAGTNYYVVNSTSSTFQLSLTAGGKPIRSIYPGGGAVSVTKPPTLNLNNTGALPIKAPGGNPFVVVDQLPAATINRGSIYLYATVTFDADLQCWMMLGGSNSTFSGGLRNCVPVEVCLALCKELGMHPMLSLPPYALDPATDYTTALASYCQSNAPPWMVPRFEPGNEVWNTVTPISLYALNKAFVHWGKQSDLNNAYGKWLSVVGQGLAGVYGLGNLGTKYEVLCGVQTDGGTHPSFSDDRLKASAYVGQSAPAQSGYSKVAATRYTSAVLVAIYVSPTMRGTNAELQNAWRYFVTNIGNPNAQMADLNAYVNTLKGEAGGFNLAYELARYRGFHNWATGLGVNKMFAYEGGYSPDLIAFGGNWLSNISGATNAASCVLTLPITTQNDGSTRSPQPGNPAAIGMVLAVSGLGPTMTQLNCLSSDNIGGVTFSNGSVSISWPSHILIANQCVQFRPSGNLPSNITAGTTYFVISSGLSSSAFQVSATRGGSPIIVVGGGSNVGIDTGWAVTAVNNTSVTIDVDSSSFGVYRGGAFPVASYLGSTALQNKFRIATLMYATDLPALLLQNYNNFTGAGGTFPSQYQLSGANSIWFCIQPDIWGTPTQEFAMIAAYNQ